MTTGDARKRVNAIKQYSSLGSGLKIAMRDLEIRGAGNLLGTQQSGHDAAIGFDLYCQVLRHAVGTLKGQQAPMRLDVALSINFLAGSEAEFQQNPDKLPAFIPESYMPEPALRIAAYKQVAEVVTVRELQELIKNWRDRFGAFPESVDNLLRCVDLKLAAHRGGISSVEIKEGKLMLTRRGEYILLGGKFPRLNVKASLKEQLLEALEFLKK
jgi:transcription-repair coupling factor (superfamily II helicase)